MYARNNPMLYTDLNGESFKDWWKKNIADPWKREWNAVFGNGFTVSVGTNMQMHGGSITVFPNAPNGMPYGGGLGFQTNNFNTAYPVFANYQGGFVSTQAVNFESNLKQTVAIAEGNVRAEYFKYEYIHQFTDIISNTNQLALIGRATYKSSPIFTPMLKQAIQYTDFGYGLDILNIGLDYASYKNNEIDKTEFHENLTIDMITPIASEGTKIYFISSGATAIEAAAAGGIIGLTIGAYYGLYRWFKPIAQEWNWQFNNWIQNMPYNLNNPAYYP